MTMDPLEDGTTAELRVLTGALARPEDEPSGFTVMSMSGEEAVSELFSFDVSVLVSPDLLQRAEDEGGVQRALLLQDVAFRVGPAGNLRFGILNEVDVEGPFLFDERVFARLRLRVVPRAWLLTQRRNSRIFQHKYVNEIVSAILHESGVRHRWDLRKIYPRRVYCTQYEETDYDFVRRLFAEEGILFFFEFRQEFEGGGRARVRQEPGEFDGLVDGLQKANKIFEGAAKEATGIAKKTGNEREEGAFGALGSVAGMAGDLLEQEHDEEDTAPRVLESGEAGPSGDGDVLVFVDEAHAYGWGRAEDGRGEPLALTLRDQAGLSGDDAQIDRLASAFKTRPEHMEARDHDFRRPLLALEARVGQPLEQELQPGLPLEIYDHHGEYLTEDIGLEGAELQLEQYRRDAALAQGRGRSARIMAGHKFRLTALVEHGRGVVPADGDYAVTRVHHQYDNPDFAAGGSGDVESMVRGCARAIREALVSGRELPETELRHIIRGMDAAAGTPRLYQSRFECIAGELAFRPPRPARVTRHVTETAVVMGPKGKDIYHDRFGRVKVQFHWDREGTFDETSSCWLRVAQPWAGAGYGFQFFPRVGMEVLVTFIGGDTDRPIVIGALYDGTHATPEPLPERMTRSGIRTQTSPHGGGFNELSFEDAKDMERVFLHAQRNLEEVVQHDHDQSVGNRQSVSVGGDQRSGIGGDQSTTVGNNRSTAVGGNASSFVQGSRTSRVLTNQLQMVEGHDNLVVGGSSVRRVDQADLTITGVHNVTAQAGASLIVTGDVDESTSATAYVKGAAYLTASERIVARTQSDEDPAMIRFECGDSVIEMHPKRILIASDTIHLLAATEVQIHSKKGMLAMREGVVLQGHNVDVVNTDYTAGLRVMPDPSTLLFADDTQLRGMTIRLGEAQPLDVPRVQGPQSQEDQPANVKLEFTHLAADDSDPIADTPYRAVAGEYTYEGTTNADGKMEIYVPDEILVLDVSLFAHRKYPDIYPNPMPLQWSFALAEELPAVSELFGAAYRLKNLGYDFTAPDAADDPSFVEALTAFQFDHEIAETGENDEDTQQKLQEVYGS